MTSESMARAVGCMVAVPFVPGKGVLKVYYRVCLPSSGKTYE